jgi:hypothetical protein
MCYNTAWYEAGMTRSQLPAPLYQRTRPSSGEGNIDSSVDGNTGECRRRSMDVDGRKAQPGKALSEHDIPL